MPGHRCIAPGCTSGYDSNKEKVHFFLVPGDLPTLQKWANAIPREGFQVKPGQKVCEKHFLPSEIIRKKPLYDRNGKVIAEQLYKRPQLLECAVPSQYPNCPKYLSATPKIKRKPPSERGIPQLAVKRRISESSVDVCILPVEDCIPPAIDGMEMKKSFDFNDLVQCTISIPPLWSQHFMAIDKTLLFCHFAIREHGIQIKGPFMKKLIWVDENLLVHCAIHNKLLNLKDFGFGSNVIQSSDDLKDIIIKVDRFSTCLGLNIQKSEEEVRSKNCHLLIDNGVNCVECKKEKRARDRKIQRHNKCGYISSALNDKKLEVLKRKCKTSMRVRQRATQKIKALRESMEKCQEDMSNMLENSIMEQVMGHDMPANLKTSLMQIVEVSKKKNRKGMRYNEDWILLCMLLHMRSPCAYNFIRSNDILPLPCVRTIRRYLSRIDTKCGFDANFFQLLEKSLEEKEEHERHGILLIDEMVTRESVSVNSRTLTYQGLVDFGDDGPTAGSFNDKANHGLVLMFQPLTGKFTQPVAVFASRGPSGGTVLAQLIIKAILMLEKSGALIHGIVADGASTNKKCWTELGVTGKVPNPKSWFTHPCDEDRKVFVFSDTPHVFKNIRNRLYNTGELQVDTDEPLIKWNYFHILHEMDRLHSLRVCPKLSASHLNLNSTAKMRVRLAVQILSASVAKGLQFYKDYAVELKDCSPTADFCSKMNALFDALNRKLPSEGLTPNSSDFKVLEESLEWLANWEEKARTGKIKKEHFLTDNTAESLRLTILSAMEITKYMVKNYGFKYVLTGKINQDALERFFGTIRQAGRCNDHPGTPTFLQLYKILACYSVLKPPKAGNCSVLTDRAESPLISLKELREIYQNPGEKSMLDKLKEKLDMAVDVADWTVEDVVECSSSLAEVNACVTYYVTGYLSKQLLKFTKCSVCISALVNPVTTFCHPVAKLTNLKTKGGLIHPNMHLHFLIMELEDLFVKFSKCTDVAERVVTEICDNWDITFPCFEHGSEMVASIVLQYVSMRMRQFSAMENRDAAKDNCRKKKAAKLTKT